MRLSRDIALLIHRLLDEYIPPAIRDTRWFMYVPLMLAFRHRYRVYLDFRERAFRMSEEEFREAYRLTSDVAFERPTDLNRASIAKIMQHVQGPSVLEAGCGKGYLSCKMSEHYKVTAVDIVLDPELKQSNPQIIFHEANLEAMPFVDKEFDTVVCTHTLEHVRNLHRSIAELRRVARRIIVVVPRQRPYQYSFDLHLNFFPYFYSLLSIFGRVEGQVICEDAGGDIFYMEDTN